MSRNSKTRVLGLIQGQNLLRDVYHTFNWFLLQAELELLQQELSATFIADLRQELDHLELRDPDQPIALIPCGQLGTLPLHAAWARHNRWTGAPIPFAETCELTYQASARSLATASKAIKTLPQQGPIIAIGNPLPTEEKPLEWATAEAEAIVALGSKNHREGKAIVETAATRAEIEASLQELQAEETRSGAWIDIASHGHADPTDPENCYMLLSANEKLTLADLQRRQLLSGVRGFIASGCTTALGDLERAPDELNEAWS